MNGAAVNSQLVRLMDVRVGRASLGQCCPGWPGRNTAEGRKAHSVLPSFPHQEEQMLDSQNSPARGMFALEHRLLGRSKNRTEKGFDPFLEEDVGLHDFRRRQTAPNRLSC